MKVSELIDQCNDVLADPNKAEYHDRVKIALDKLQNEIDFWRALNEALET